MKEAIQKYQIDPAVPFDGCGGYSKLEDATLRMMPLAYQMMNDSQHAIDFQGINSDNIIEAIAHYARYLALSALNSANENQET